MAGYVAYRASDNINDVPVSPATPLPVSVSAGVMGAGVDGLGNVARPDSRIYTPGTPIEAASWSLASSNATTGPIGMKGFGTASINVAGTWVGTLTFQCNPSLDNTTWTALNVTPLNGGTAVSTTTANGAWTYTNVADMPIRAILTYTSGTATVVISKGNAAQTTGLPLYSPPDAFTATRFSTDYAGTVINPALFGTPTYSTVAADGAAYGATGLGDFVTDLGSGSLSGTHALYCENVTYGSVHSGTPASNTNPYSYSNGVLSCTSSYSTPDSWWQGWQLHLGSQNYYQQEGYNAPGYGFYYEVSAQCPSSLPAGMFPWFCPVWMTTASSYPGLTGPFALTPGTQGYSEFDGPEFATQPVPGGSIDGLHYQCTLHDWPPSAGNQPGLIQAQRTIASALQGFNLYDGAYHTYGVLVTKNYFVVFIDRKEICRLLKPSQKESLGRYTLKLNNSFFNVPTSSTSTTITMNINAIKVWQYSPAVASIYPA